MEHCWFPHYQRPRQSPGTEQTAERGGAWAAASDWWILCHVPVPCCKAGWERESNGGGWRCTVKLGVLQNWKEIEKTKQKQVCYKP